MAVEGVGTTQRFLRGNTRPSFVCKQSAQSWGFLVLLVWFWFFFRLPYRKHRQCVNYTARDKPGTPGITLRGSGGVAHPSGKGKPDPRRRLGSRAPPWAQGCVGGGGRGQTAGRAPVSAPQWAARPPSLKSPGTAVAALTGRGATHPPHSAPPRHRPSDPWHRLPPKSRP